MPCVSTSESTTHPPAWGPRRNSVYGVKGGARSQCHPPYPDPRPPTHRKPCPAHLCLHHRGALGPQRVADGNGVGQHSALVAFAVPTPGAQGHVWGMEEQSEDTSPLPSGSRRPSLLGKVPVLWRLAPKPAPPPCPHPGVCPIFLLDA